FACIDGPSFEEPREMVLDLFSLAGKVALVTGAARGLGRAMSVALAEAGADIFAVDLEACAETLDAVEERGRRIGSLIRDLGQTDAEGARRIIEECTCAMGRLDILVNNAGIIRRAS